jgi:4'-phosphopantetheinyl transferase EntD
LPLFYQHNINDSDRLGVWSITEEEHFFFSRVPLHRNISHERKRLQHLAGRYLLQYLYPDFPYELIEIADTRRPFIKNESFHFSISHCGDFAAAIVSKVNRVGVDIELVTPMIEKIQHKFLSEDELMMMGKEQGETAQAGAYDVETSNVKDETSNVKGELSNIAGEALRIKPQTSNLKPQTSNLPWLTMLWSAKEAIYKWYADGQVDFKKHIQYTGVYRELEDDWVELAFLFTKEKPVPLRIRSRFFGLLVVSYVQP